MRELTPEQEERLRERAAKHVNGVVSKLSAMQRQFLIEYLVSSNATEAARRAGYSNPGKAGSRVLGYDKIQEAISDYFFGPEMEAREVIQRLGQQARAEYAAYWKVSKHGDLSLDVAAMVADGKGHLIKGVKETKYGQVIELVDMQAALFQIGRYHKLFTDGVDVTSGEQPVPFADIVAAMQRARKAGVDE
jgi:hypothetical protein